MCTGQWSGGQHRHGGSLTVERSPKKSFLRCCGHREQRSEGKEEELGVGKHWVLTQSEEKCLQASPLPHFPRRSQKRRLRMAFVKDPGKKRPLNEGTWARKANTPMGVPSQGCLSPCQLPSETAVTAWTPVLVWKGQLSSVRPARYSLCHCLCLGLKNHT